MPELASPVGLGLAARGEVRKAVAYAERAEELGLEGVWVHDSYFERDAVTYLSAMALKTQRIGLGAGALNPYTRHAVAVAMTLSALDDLAPRRCVLALGSGLPLRLSQMGIEYGDTVAKVSEAIDQIRTLWRGERLQLNQRVPPLQPMFQPPHRIPIYVAAYRTPFLDLCGEKADGYLARPAESLPAFARMRERVLQSAASHGRAASAIDFRGYLLTLVDASRREALNRAKREPFVIYMMSVLSDISLKRAGFEPALRDAIAKAWRAEDYHAAGQLIPDSLLDAFILCGRIDDVAAMAAAYHEAGMDVPLLQPILQEDAQVEAVLSAAVAYATRGVVSPATVTAERAVPEPAAAAGGEPVARRIGRRLDAWWEIVRPFSFTASMLPVLVGGAVAFQEGRMHWVLFLAALLASLGLHLGTNVVNEIYDVRHGIDAITSPRMSMAILKGRVSEREAFIVAWSGFLIATLLGLYLISQRGVPILLLGLLGLAGGYFYTAPPFQYKYRALGLPLVFLLMGPVMVLGGYYAITGRFQPSLLVVSVPVGLLVTAILHGNEWRDIAEDSRHGFTTLSAQVGRDAAHWIYVMLVVGAYVAVGMGVMVGVIPRLALLTLLSLPLAAWILRSAELGGYYAITGRFQPSLLVVSVPVGLLVTAILHGNEWRDIAEDSRHGFTTLSAQVGRDAAHWIYVMLVLGAYVAVGMGVMVGLIPRLALLTLLSLPLAAWILRSAELGASGHLRAIAMIDLMTARLHSAFGALLLVGLVAGSALH